MGNYQLIEREWNGFLFSGGDPGAHADAARGCGRREPERDEVVLAYAKTAHKAQGAEYPIVVIVFVIDAREMTCLHIECVSTDLPGSPASDNVGSWDKDSANQYIAGLLSQ